MKQCQCCKIEKENKDFTKKSSNLDGLCSYCRECSSEKNRISYRINEESRKEWQSKYRSKNIESIKEKSKAYYKKNQSLILEKRKEYKEKNRERISIKEALRRLSDPGRFEKNKAKHFSWSKNNRERINAQQREWYQKNKEKRMAHVILSRAINAGKIMRPQTCSECSKKCKPDGHHVDYTKPLEVIWICRACHSRKSPRTVIKCIC